MTHEIIVSLPEELYLALSIQAASRGKPLLVHVSQLLTEAVDYRNRQPTDTSEKSAGHGRFEDCFGIVDEGDYGDADNETIDADLAREYGQQ